MGSEAVIALAFGAGVISFFSPCSVGVLPAFISYYLGRHEADAPAPIILGREHRLFLAGLVAALIGGGLILAAVAHNLVDLDQNRLADIVAALVGGLVLSAGLVVALTGRASLESDARAALRAAILRGIGFGLIATVGFVVVYGGLGVVARLALGGDAPILRLVSLATASFVVALGVLLAIDRSPFTYIPALRAPKARTVGSFLFFGTAYALISTSCLLPVFLGVLAATLTLSIPETIVAFLAMAGGSGLLMTTTATYVSLAKQTSVGYIRRLRPFVKPIAGALVIGFGSYTLFFDLTTFYRVEAAFAASSLVALDAVLILAAVARPIARAVRALPSRTAPGK